MAVNHVRHLFRNWSNAPQRQENTWGKRNFMILGIIAFIILICLVALAIEISLILSEADYEPTGDTGCQINPFEVDPSPLLTFPGSSDFIYPKHGDKLLKFSAGQPLYIACPGGTVIFDNSTTLNSLVTGTCVSESTFKIAGKDVNWKNIRCSTSPVSTIRYTGNRCENNGKEIEIGFSIGSGFLRSNLICFNQELQEAYYSFVKLPASINQRINSTQRPATFQQGLGIYNITSVNNLYLRSNQRSTINTLLGLRNTSTAYIKNDSEFFLSKGHLTANMDNFYAAQQNATFYFPNAAPQWQTFNGKNWNQVEIDVRNYAEKQGVELHVWTGIYGIATLPNASTGKPTKLYLYVDKTSNKTALPVPEVYWKVVFQPSTKKGIALIGVNNPYSSNFTKLCSDVSGNLTWLNWNKTNQQQGYCYACTINNFKRNVFPISNIVDNGLLI